MADYNLSGLSTRSFEKLVQALAAKILGPGIFVFGDGPDGGREATFEGRVPFPSANNPWDGYGVIQAKFLQRPRDPEKDGKWALAELEKELKLFLAPSKRRRPDYYLFATNVVLTPVQGTGSKDKISSLLHDFQEKINLRDWRIWDFDQIGTFLDDFGEIRRAYAAWITPGDVLSEVIKHMENIGPDVLDIMTNFLAKQLLTDQFANLGQAGSASEDKIQLARVFVDLPTTTERTAEPPEGRGIFKITELVQELVEVAQEPLNLQPHPQEVGTSFKLPTPEPGRYVLVGGPGQGKTTISQFACQLFRAAILKNRPPHLLSFEVRQALQAILNQCEEGGPPLPLVRRFPIRIVLNSFAAALQEAKHNSQAMSVLSYIAQVIQNATGRTIGIETLRLWLSAYPWFIVFDGLDEVPASTNREELLESIQNFWVDTVQLSADILVLATTRPQGYNDDFSPEVYKHLWLAPLSPKRALRYARKLVNNRWSNDQARHEKVLSHLTKASYEEATARLMRTPLQITIMAILVDQIGPPPQDRWPLFNQYYNVIYRREQERNIPASELLRHYRPDIDSIHNQVALALQIESELAGGTEARMSTERLAGIVTARLKDEGQTGEALNSLRERIIDAAANRLVFLVGLQEGQVGFEIRSFQEFMAAEALLSGGDSVVQARLRQIAPAASWRNVFLFAAGRCFEKEQHRRDTICTICGELNSDAEKPLEIALLSGSVLALDLLEEGLSRQQPKYHQLLVHFALELLTLPASDAHIRLADLCEGILEEPIRQCLSREITRAEHDHLGPWTTLLSLIDQGPSWAEALADANWPITPAAQMAIFSLPSASRARRWLSARLRESLPQLGQSTLGGLSFGRWEPDLGEHTPLIYSLGPKDSQEIRLADGASLELALLSDTAPLSKVPLDFKNSHPDWLILAEGRRFLESPSKKQLARSLGLIAEVGLLPTAALINILPWPIAACINASGNAYKLKALSDKVSNGELGDLKEWLAAEDRWRKFGVTATDLLADNSPDPFPPQIATIGIPTRACTWSISSSITAEALSLIHDIYLESANIGHVHELLTEMLIPAIGYAGTIPNALNAETFCKAAKRASFAALDIIDPILERYLSTEEQLMCLDALGRVENLYRHRETLLSFEESLGHYYLQSKSPGILRLIAYSITHEGRSPNLPPIRVESSDDPMTQHTKLIIELEQGNFSTTRIRELTQITIEISSLRPRIFKDVASLIGRLESRDELICSYLLDTLKFRNVLGEDLTNGILEGLADLLLRRRTNLTDSRVWKYLALPEELRDFIAYNPR